LAFQYASTQTKSKELGSFWYWRLWKYNTIFAIAKLLFAMASFPWVLLILTWILTGWKHSTDSTEINYNFQVSNISTLWSRSLQKFW